MSDSIKAGTTNVTTYFQLRNVADGTDATGKTITAFDLQYVRSGATPVVKVDATALAAANSAHADNKMIEVDSADQPATYRVDWPDAAFITGVREVVLTVKHADIQTASLRMLIDPPANMTQINGDTSDATDLGLAIDNDSNLVKSNLTEIAGSVQSVTDLKDFADSGYDPSTNKVQGVVLVDTTTAVTNELNVNVVKISGDAIAADNLEAILDGTGAAMTLKSSTQSPLHIEATGGGFSGMKTIGNAAGSGFTSTGGATGHGIHAKGGATSGQGLKAEALGTGSHGVRFIGTGAFAGLKAEGGSDGSGLQLDGSGSGSGILAAGGATGHGARFDGSASGHGIFAISPGGSGMRLEGGGNSAGLFAISGNGFGAGIHAEGGSSGEGILAQAGGGVTGGGTNIGLRIIGKLVGHGLSAESGPGATGDAIKAEAKSTNGNGLNVIGKGTGHGLTAVKGATGKDIDADEIDTIKTDVAAILVDTAVIGSPAGASIAADIAAVKSDSAAILVDTADMQPKLGTPAADLAADIAAVKVDTAAILVDTTAGGAGPWTQQPAGMGITPLASGTAQSGGSNFIQLAASETFANDELDGNIVNIVFGTGAGQSRVITNHVGATDTSNVSPDWATNPDATSGYEVVQGSANITTVSLTAEDLPTATALAAVQADVTAILADTADMQPKLGTPVADISADIAATKTVVDSILVDTADMQPKLGTPVADISADIAASRTVINAIFVDTGDIQPKIGTPVTDLAADIAAVKVDTAAILVDTADMQPKLGTPAADISADIAATKSVVDAILVDTADMQPKLGTPAGASMSADIAAVKSETALTKADTTLLIKFRKNSKIISKIAAEFFLITFDDNDTTEIARQELKTFDGTTIAELAGTGQASQRKKSTV